MKRNFTTWWRDIIISRTGYTGEDGLELIVAKKEAPALWDAFIKEGVQPCGLGARDTLRLEAGMPLYGHELNETLDPLSAGLAWAVDLHKDFIGAPALRKVHEERPKQTLVGLLIDGPRAARQDMTVLHHDVAVGKITSGAMSPTLKRCIAMAYVQPPLAAPGTKLAIDCRGSRLDATVTPLPFYKRPQSK